MRVSLEKAIQLIQEGHVVAVPTETVYGLAASLKFPAAINKIFEIKGRPSDKPLSLLISNEDHVQALSQNLPQTYQTLKTLWPGPLTIVVEANCITVPDEVRVGLSTVGLRMPQHDLLLKLIEQTGPLAAPSANPSDEAPATNAAQIETYFGLDLPILDGGETTVGIASTIVKLEAHDFKILRQGSIELKQIKNLLG